MTQQKRRNSLRLQGYDYAWEGAYFVTICAHERQHLFGKIVEGQMNLSVCGEIVAREWLHTTEKRPYAKSPAFVVMPNHFHAVIVIDHQDVAPPKLESVGARRASPNVTGVATQSLGAIVGSFKSAVTKCIHEETDFSTGIWQRGYHEHIIRNEESYNQIHTYILNNPVHWKHDSFFSVE